MIRAAIVLTTGFEEIEALTVVDVLRRGDVDIKILSLLDILEVNGKHDIMVTADALFAKEKPDDYEMMIIPGGTTAYLDYPMLQSWVKDFDQNGKKLAAICAAPSVLGQAGVLNGKEATCFPGIEEYLPGAMITGEMLTVDGNITTGKGPAAAMEFAFSLLETIKGKETTQKIRKDMLLI